MSKLLVKTSCVLFHGWLDPILSLFYLRNGRRNSTDTDDASLPRSLLKQFWIHWFEINVQPIRSTTQIWVVSMDEFLHSFLKSFCVETILVESRNVDCFPLLNERRLYAQTSSFVNNEKRLQIIKLYNYLTFTERYQMKVYRHQEK